MTTFSDTWKHWFAVVYRSDEVIGEIALPGDTLGVAVFDNQRLTHLTVSTPNSGLRLTSLDLPDVSTAITYGFIFFHLMSLVGFYDSG